jgi:hypothetical protein
MKNGGATLRSGEVKDEALRGILPGIGAKARALLVRTLNESRFDGTLPAEYVREMAGFESKPVSGMAQARKVRLVARRKNKIMMSTVSSLTYLLFARIFRAVFSAFLRSWG